MQFHQRCYVQRSTKKRLYLVYSIYRIRTTFTRSREAVYRFLANRSTTANVWFDPFVEVSSPSILDIENGTISALSVAQPRPFFLYLLAVLFTRSLHTNTDTDYRSSV